MACENYGLWYKSKAVTWAASASQNDFPVDFLAPAVRGALAPRIAEFKIKVTYSGTTAASTGSARGSLPAQIITNLMIYDKYGLRVQLSGACLRLVDQFEYGAGLGFVDPPSAGAGATITNQIFYLRVPMGRLKAKRPQDTRWNATDMLDGGRITMDFNAAAIGSTTNVLTVTAATVEVWCRVVDEKVDEEKSRTIWRNQIIIGGEQAFPLSPGGARLFMAYQYVGNVGENKATPDTWTATQNIISRGLNLNSVPADLLKDEYRSSGIYVMQDPGATGTIVLGVQDSVEQGTSISLFNPTRTPGQGITELPELSSLDWKTDQAFGSGTFVAADSPQMLVGYIENRPHGCGSDNMEPPAHYMTAGGIAVPATAVGPTLAQKLPATAGPPPNFSRGPR